MNSDFKFGNIQVTDLCHDDDLDQFRDNEPIRSGYSGKLLVLIFFIYYLIWFIKFNYIYLSISLFLYFIIKLENEFCWQYYKSFLKIISLEKDGESKILSKFNFGQLLRDKTVYISDITELKEINYLSDCFDFCKYKLIISLNRESSGSFLLIIDIKNQCILKCIECPFKIKHIEPISNTNGKNDYVNLPFCQELQIMCGIIAISTTNATVMILDLALDTITNDCFDITTQSPSQVTVVVKKEGLVNNYDLEQKRKISIIHNQHICISVNDECIYKNEFRYSFDDDGNPRYFQKEDTYVSALKYFYQTNTLYIGYNFGGVHHFDLQTFTIYKTDELEGYDDDDDDESIFNINPVVGFSIQEPENDPRNFCYLWLLKGQLVQDFGTLNTNEIDNQYYNCSSISLNVLEFQNKNWIDNYGYLYSDFISSSPRFHYSLTSNSYDQIEMNSIILNYGTISQGTFKKKINFT